jgi:hypothetical protein
VQARRRVLHVLQEQFLAQVLCLPNKSPHYPICVGTFNITRLAIIQVPNYFDWIPVPIIWFQIHLMNVTANCPGPELTLLNLLAAFMTAVSNLLIQRLSKRARCRSLYPLRRWNLCCERLSPPFPPASALPKLSLSVSLSLSYSLTHSLLICLQVPPPSQCPPS